MCYKYKRKTQVNYDNDMPHIPVVVWRSVSVLVSINEAIIC